MLVKYIDNKNVQYANYKHILKYDDVQVINPREADFLVAGYKELVIDEEPSYNQDTQYLDYYFENKDNQVIQHWKIGEITEEGV